MHSRQCTHRRITSASFGRDSISGPIERNLEDLGGNVKSTTRSAIGALACSITMCVSAQTQPAGKTRAEVRAELVEAQRDGVVPAPKYDYPPSQDTIERN